MSPRRRASPCSTGPTDAALATHAISGRRSPVGMRVASVAERYTKASRSGRNSCGCFKGKHQVHLQHTSR